MSKAKRVANILLLRPAMSSRNLTSLLLVALLFGVYVAAGGRVEVVPRNIKGGPNFGGVTNQKVKEIHVTGDVLPAADAGRNSKPSPAPSNATSGNEKGQLGTKSTEKASSPASDSRLSDLEARLKGLSGRPKAEREGNGRK